MATPLPSLWPVSKRQSGLSAVDTPETHDPRRPVQCFGQTAADFTTKLLSGQKVRLEADARDSNRDKYGRLLRYVYLADGTLVNAKLIADGYGFAYTGFDYTKIDDFRQLEATAKQDKLGLWQACRVDDTQIVKQTIAR
ncbi:thermonuclease family protein [bacterium]|nr:MAG: thermonuclease family protein [bacterium]